MSYSTSTIAKGCFGKVYKEKYNDTWAAVKRVPQQLISRKDLERECDVYNKANHPNIVKLLGNISLKDGKWVIPLEFVFGEDLETTIFKAAQSKIQLTPTVKGTIIIGMCEGLFHLHSKDIVHQDLKPDNIMVEHQTNRAVIIDLGLAKFFRHGLNSAVDMGNEAYSAPEVLQRHSQRDQRSDVWAMGKIIAELCARIRLYTPSVCPDKIKETLRDQAFCHPVCRMVEPNPALRASMAGVMSDIRRAGGGFITNTHLQKDLLKPPAPGNYGRNQSPSPVNKPPIQLNRDPSPHNRDLLQNKDPLPHNRDPSPHNRDLLQNKDPLPHNRNLLYNRDLLQNKDPLPHNRDLLQNKDPLPHNRDPLPHNRNLLYNRDLLQNKDPLPHNRDLLQNKDPLPHNRDLLQNKDPLPHNRDLLHNRDPPLNKGPSLLNWERAPRPQPKIQSPPQALQLHSPPQLPKTEDKNKNQAVVPVGGANVTRDFMKMRLYQEASKDLPCDLPATGRVVVRRFEEKDGEVETWEQKEVVMCDGRIIKFDNIKFDSK
ncbi:uncharacterized protein zmp:0000000881 [Betta splendens]|uniref:Uncharacterized protein zmp:0000000881 n=1 Tax=Betta splendens TaxID=158456 RepID=A0A6P7KPT8_BETSP|nr:uncharacterized protein zmp:0000000881 [Betta splendens]